jgi:hypothetical protein
MKRDRARNFVAEIERLGWQEFAKLQRRAGATAKDAAGVGLDRAQYVPGQEGMYRCSWDGQVRNLAAVNGHAHNQGSSVIVTHEPGYQQARAFDSFNSHRKPSLLDLAIADAKKQKV